MEISEKEYYELKQKVLELQYKVDGINKPQKDIASLVTEKPISFVKNIEDDAPIFAYSYLNSDAWLLFVKLAKMIHAKSRNFYMGTTFPGSNIPYIRTCGDTEAPRKISELSEEQKQISADMLNELIPIYNKYFKKTHQTVLYSENNDGIYREVNVFRVEEGEEE